QKNCNQMVISYVRYSLVNYFYSLWLTPTASICLALCFIPFTRYCKFSSLSTFSFHVHFSFDLYIWLILIAMNCGSFALETSLSFTSLKISTGILMLHSVLSLNADISLSYESLLAPE